MPRTRRQQNLVETSLEKPLVVSGDEGDVAPPREPKISRETKERLRNQQRSWVGRMYEYAKAFLQQGMERWETEGVGDCWLLTILAGWELNDPDVVYKVPQERRGALCTSRRNAIVNMAADAKKNSAFRLLCEMCGLTVDFKNPADVRRAESEISKRLADWKKERHYGGGDQNLMHACTGWFLQRNLLNIDFPERVMPGYSALNATPCPPAATHDLLCVCAVGMHVTALLNRAGVGIDHGSVNLLDHDLEEIITSGNPPPTSRGLVGRGEDALESEEKLAERLARQQALLEKNLQYIVANRANKRGGWTIMFNVRSSPFSPRALALHSLAATLVRRLRATTTSPWCPFSCPRTWPRRQRLRRPRWCGPTTSTRVATGGAEVRPTTMCSSAWWCSGRLLVARWSDSASRHGGARARRPRTLSTRRRAFRPIRRESCPPRGRARRLGRPDPSQRRRRRR